MALSERLTSRRLAKRESKGLNCKQNADMPIFEYACRACGREFETLVRPGDTPACPACASQELEKLLSAVAVKTEGTRQLGLRAAKERDKKQQAQQTRERIEYEASHDD